MNKDKQHLLPIAGISFILYVLFNTVYFFASALGEQWGIRLSRMLIFSDDFAKGMVMGTSSFEIYISTFILFILLIFTGVSILSKKNKLVIIGFSSIALVHIYKLLYHILVAVDVPYMLTRISVICDIFTLLSIFFVLVLLIYSCKGKQCNLSKYWFMPLLFELIGTIILFISFPIGYVLITYTVYLLIKLLYLAGLSVVSYVYSSNNRNVVKTINETENGNQNEYSKYQYIPTEEKGYCDLAKHIILLLFTFGIWQYIWIYRTTDFLNRTPNEEHRDPTNKLLLCMFIPFYYIYWTYKSAQRIDKLSISKGYQSDISTLCLILSIFVGIVPPILMQDKMNNIIKPKTIINDNAASTTTSVLTATPIGVADEIKKYKELLDSGIITEEEFEAKKKQLLGL